MKKEESELTLVEIERRERNRSKVRRSYYRKIYNLNELRAQVDVLEDEYERILIEQEQRAARYADEMALEAEALEPSPSRQQLLLELARVRKNLYKENEDLRNLQMEHDKAHGSLQHLLDVKQQDTEKETAAHNAKEMILLRPFSIGECLEVSRVAYNRISSYIEAQKANPPGFTVLGWTDRRCLLDGVLSFCFQKTFTHRRADEVSNVTWRMMTQPKELVQLYSPYLNMRYHVVQQLDENNYIVYRTVDQMDLDVVQKSLFLMTRFKTEKGVMFVSHGLDSSRIEDNSLDLDKLGKRERWEDVFSWVLVEDHENGTDCMFSFGGAVVAKDPSNLFWLIEVLLVILRWEIRAVGSLFVLQEHRRPQSLISTV